MHQGRLSLLMITGVVNRILNGRDFFSFFIWNFDSKLIFKSHDQLYGVKGVGAQVSDKRFFAGHLAVFQSAMPSTASLAASMATAWMKKPLATPSPARPSPVRRFSRPEKLTLVVSWGRGRGLLFLAAPALSPLTHHQSCSFVFGIPK